MSREHRRLKEILEIYDEIVYLNSQVIDCESLIDDPEMGEEARDEIDTLQEKVCEKKHKLTISMLPPDPESGKNTIIEIRAGAGGDEASIFAGDLFRMYTRFAETKGWGREC